LSLSRLSDILKSMKRTIRQNNPIAAGDIREVTVTSLGDRGIGVARLGNGILFIPRGRPGDRVEVKLTKWKNKFGSAEIVNILEPSKMGCDPGCKSFERGCGGCQLLHLKPSEVRAWKQKYLRDSLKKHIPLSFHVPDILAHPEPQTGYRNKFSLQVDGPTSMCGIMSEYSRSIVPVKTCPITAEGNQKGYDLILEGEAGNLPDDITQLHLRSNRNGEWGLLLYATHFTREMKAWAKALVELPDGAQGVGVQAGKQYRLLAGKPDISETIGGITYRIPHNGFFQTNTMAAEKLLGLALYGMKAQKGDRIVDLYSGAGFFSIPLARTGATVIGIEGNPDSVTYAEINAAAASCEKIRFITGEAATGLEELQPKDMHKLILDPPRSGCEPEVIDAILRLKPKRIVYISCDPVTLGRDLGKLVPRGYRVETCQGIDMFPGSYHLETVVTLNYG